MSNSDVNEKKCTVACTKPANGDVTNEITQPIRDQYLCPNCNKDIDLDDIKRICVDANNSCLIENDSFISEALDALNKYRQQVGIKTCVAKAHFLAHICQESRFYDVDEKFNYSWQDLKNKFDAFKTVAGSKKAKELEENKKKGDDVSKEIANWVYAYKNGNNGFKSGDGYQYRGRGFIHIVGKGNYQDLANYFNEQMKLEEYEAHVDWVHNPDVLANNPCDAIISALALWGKNNLSKLAGYNSEHYVIYTTAIISNTKGIREPIVKSFAKIIDLDERIRFFNKAVEVLKVNECGLEAVKNKANKKGTVIVVSGTDVKKEKDRAQSIYWAMYKTSVYRNMSLDNYHELKKYNRLPQADYVTYLSRDAHKSGIHNNKRYGPNNEAPSGEYYLIPNSGKSYKMYLSDDGKKAKIKIEGVDNTRTDIAIHQFGPRYSLGCLTFNSGTNEQPVIDFIAQIPDLSNKDVDVRIIIEKRHVTECGWDVASYGATKWVGVLPVS